MFVTGRIMKYPLLIDALIKTAKDRPADQENLVQSKMFVKVSLVVEHSLRFANSDDIKDFNFSLILTFSNLIFISTLAYTTRS